MTALPKLFLIISKDLIVAAVKKVIRGTAEIAQVMVEKKMLTPRSAAHFGKEHNFSKKKINRKFGGSFTLGCTREGEESLLVQF